MWRRQSDSSRMMRAGQTIYVVMLVMACVFLCIAIALPTYEFISRKYWQHPARTAPGAAPAGTSGSTDSTSPVPGP